MMVPFSEAWAAPGAGTTVFVCISCAPEGIKGTDAKRPGQTLANALAERCATLGAIRVSPVECLAVCKRPCTVAITAGGKWTYVVGDLDPAQHIEEIVAAATAFDASSNGIVAWRERPQTFRQGVIARVPPLGFIQPPPPPRAGSPS